MQQERVPDVRTELLKSTGQIPASSDRNYLTAAQIPSTVEDVLAATLFVENTPISEATRGVIAVLEAFQLPTDSPNLDEARSFFGAQTIEEHIRNVFRMSGVSVVAMTNDPLDPEESPFWLKGVQPDRQF